MNQNTRRLENQYVNPRTGYGEDYTINWSLDLPVRRKHKAPQHQEAEWDAIHSRNEMIKHYCKSH